MVNIGNLHPTIRATLGVLLAVLLSVVLIEVRQHVEPRHALISYILLVIVMAYSIGPASALASGATSLVLFALFFMPSYASASDTAIPDIAVLVGFAAVVVLESHLAGMLRRRREESDFIAERSNFASRIASLLVEHDTALTSDGEVMRTLAEGTGASAAVLYLYDPLSDRLTPFSSASPQMDALARAVTDCDCALGDPRLNAPAADYPGTWPRFNELPAGLQGAGIPVTTSERLEGVLCLVPPASGVFAPSRIRLAVTAATLIATALERMRLESIAGERKAEASAQHLKAVFMSSVSHELKSPLAALEAITSDWMADRDLTGVRVEQDLPIVRDALERLTSNITDLLNLTRLQGDALQTRFVGCETGDIVARALEMLDEPLRSRVDPDVEIEPLVVMCDFDQLARALSSIIRNALAYGGPGRVRVGSRQEQHAVRLWVEDEGPGIEPAERARVFEPFYRGEKTRSSIAGSGVGLAIAREVVRYHGGELHVEDVKPHGSRFVMTLPAGDAPVGDGLEAGRVQVEGQSSTE